MSFTFERPEFLSFGGAAAAAASAVLADGPIGLYWRRDVAREFQACGEACDLSGIHTTCGVFASACWWWAGRRPFARSRGKLLQHGGHIGGALVGRGGWLEIGPEHWVANDGKARPDVGDILTESPPHRLDLTHHVELAMETTPDRLVVTAHGGDSPTYGELVAAGIAADHEKCAAARGTVARLGAGPKSLDKFSGWYSAASVAAAEGL